MSTKNKPEAKLPTPNMGELNKLLQDAHDALEKANNSITNLNNLLDEERRAHDETRVKCRKMEVAVEMAKLVIHMADIDKNKLRKELEEVKLSRDFLRDKNTKLSHDYVEVSSSNLGNDAMRQFWKTSFFILSAISVFVFVLRIVKGVM